MTKPLASTTKRLAVAIAVVPLLLGGCQLGQQLFQGAENPAGDEAARRGADSITPAEMRSRIAFLASDEMRGRDTTSPGQETAAAYIAGE
jgi:hypothetical protein